MLPKLLNQQNNPKSQTTSANPTMNFATALEDILGQQLRLTRYRPNSNARPCKTNIKVRGTLLVSLARIQHIDRMQKWLNYSFIFVLISLTSLGCMRKIQKNFLTKMRLISSISISIKE